MKEQEWKELERLSRLYYTGKLSAIGEENYHILLKKTEGELEHPEWYQDTCYCQLCMSYAGD